MRSKKERKKGIRERKEKPGIRYKGKKEGREGIREGKKELRQR